MNKIQNKNINIDNFDTTNEQFQKIFEIVNNTNRSLLITGEAGSGKSTILNKLHQFTHKNIVVLAPTGLAAVNVNGQTIHRFCSFPPRMLIADDISETKNPMHAKTIRKMDILIIDEISMVRADTFDAIDLYLRLNRKINEPFGGLQIILFGDVMQLSPIINKEDSGIYFERYKSPYFFDSYVFGNLDIEIIKLVKNYRQINDQNFLSILRQIKQNKIDNNFLEMLNSNCLNNEIQEGAVCLTTTNNLAFEINEQKLKALSSKTYSFEAVISGDISSKDCPADQKLYLKKGAQIMFIKNDPLGRWVNGTVGVVKYVNDFVIEVTLENKNSVEVEPVRWENIRYYYDEESGSIKPQTIGYIEQYPIKLAWAVTVHKSQGQTFESVIINLGNGSFAHGQTYVALSRCKTLEGIKLIKPLTKKDFIVDHRVLEFLEEYQIS
jgi:ATP-dependent exoDNAse (exonuclease V) alpha subunit